MMKLVFKRLPDVFHSCSGFCDGGKGVNCVFCEFEFSRPVNQIEKWSCCVNYKGVVSPICCLLFYSMVMKIVFKRLHDVCHSCSDICDGSKDFHFVVCDFRSGAPFFSD